MQGSVAPPSVRSPPPSFAWPHLPFVLQSTANSGGGLVEAAERGGTKRQQEQLDNRTRDIPITPPFVFTHLDYNFGPRISGRIRNLLSLPSRCRKNAHKMGWTLIWGCTFYGIGGRSSVRGGGGGGGGGGRGGNLCCGGRRRRRHRNAGGRTRDRRDRLKGIHCDEQG